MEHDIWVSIKPLASRRSCDSIRWLLCYTELYHLPSHRIEFYWRHVMMLCVVRELCWRPCRWPPGSRWCSSSGVHAGRRWTRLTAGTPGPPSGHPAEGCRSHRDTWGPGGPGGGRPAGRLERDRGQQHKPSHNWRRASGCVGLCIIPNVLVQCQFGYLGFSTGSRTIVFFLYFVVFLSKHKCCFLLFSYPPKWSGTTSESLEWY